MQALEAEGLEDARSLVAARGLLSEDRAREIGSWTGSQGGRSYVGGAGREPWNTVLLLEEGTRLSTATTQWVLTPTSTSVTVEARVRDDPSSSAWTSGDFDLRLLTREGEPIHYAHAEGTTTLTLDREVEGEGGSEQRWVLEGLVPGVPVYLHLVNRGTSPPLLTEIRHQ